MNFAESKRAELQKRHYFIGSPGHPRRWVAYSPKKVNRYREEWGDDFCLVVVGDPSKPDDFYAIPWVHISDLFRDDNVYLLRLPDGRMMPQWKMHLEGPPHVFQLELPKDDPRPRPRFDAAAWYGNRGVLLGGSTLDQ